MLGLNNVQAFLPCAVFLQCTVVRLFGKKKKKQTKNTSQKVVSAVSYLPTWAFGKWQNIEEGFRWSINKERDVL